MTTTDRARLVRCPVCSASPGTDCAGIAGNHDGEKVHRLRTVTARTALRRGEVDVPLPDLPDLSDPLPDGQPGRGR
jgi:hypothetical protein